MRKLKRIFITVKPKNTAINGDPQELQDLLNDFCTAN